jgi:hypothetical protein
MGPKSPATKLRFPMETLEKCMRIPGADFAFCELTRKVLRGGGLQTFSTDPYS